MVIEFVGHEVDGATSESAAHDARTGDAFFAGNVVEEVEFFAGHFIFLREALVRFVHHLAYGFVVALFECVAHGEYAITFANYVESTECIFFRHGAAHFFELFDGGIAERFDFGVEGVDGFSDAFAAATAVVVRRTHEFVLHLRVNEHEFVAFGIEGEVFELTAAAVEAHEGALLTVNGGKLVHDAAVAAHILVFRALTHACKFHFLDFVFAPKVVESESKARFECSGAAHSGTEGNIAGESRVESFDGYAECHHFAANTEDVARPSCRGTCFIVERELHVVFQVDGISANRARAIGLNLGDDALLYGAGENESVVIVSVLADEVDTSGSSIYGAGGSVEMFGEPAANVVDCEFHDEDVFERVRVNATNVRGLRVAVPRTSRCKESFYLISGQSSDSSLLVTRLPTSA